MSAPKLISPLLDNFIMGEPISDQGGVRCCPAMHQQTEEKYIVKIISIPANQSQLDALLLTGAYGTAEDANGYFKDLADSIVKDADVLKQLTKFGGFDAYTDCQVVSMDDGNGYDVYLLAPYRRNWLRHSQLNPATHLDGYNLALDICAALTAARRNGHLFVNLSPENVYVTPANSYHIGEIGFLGLNFLKYSSLPSAYFGPYTAPEVADALSEVSNTLDIYALGMLLYEVFNGGKLPFEGARAEQTVYPAPAYADAEMADIILKAIDPDPSQRWQDPAAMGQAVVSLMQRNGVSDAPIVPVVPDVVTEDIVVTAAVDCCDETTIASEEIPVADVTEEVQAEAEESAPEPAEEIVEAAADDEAAVVTADNVLEEAAIEAVPDAVPTEETAIDAAQEVVVENADECIPTSVDEIEQAIQEVLPMIEQTGDTHGEEEQDIDSVLAQVDALISDSEELPQEEYEQLSIADMPVNQTGEVDTSDDTILEEQPPRKSKRRIIAIIAAAILLLTLLGGGYFFYQYIYLQEINELSVIGEKDSITVTVETAIDSDKLTVVCTDDAGVRFTAPLTNYSATISGLSADTAYTVTLEIDGFHKLTGETQYSYHTQEKTVVSDFKVLVGEENNSAVVSFKLNCPDNGKWSALFRTDGADDIQVPISNCSGSVSGLTDGAAYTVILSNEDKLFIEGSCQVTFAAGSVVTAVAPYVQSCVDKTLTVKWSEPSDSAVASWTVHCFNEVGFDQTVMVTEPIAVFENVDDRDSFQIEIYAQGQSLAETLEVSENSITLSDIKVDVSMPGTVTVNWTSNAEIPTDGYLISYRIAGSEEVYSFTAKENKFTLTSAVPDAEHTFTIATGSKQSVLHEAITAKPTGSASFSGYGVTTSNMRFNMCLKPAKSNWSHKDVRSSDYRTTFTSTQKAAFVIRLLHTYYTSTDSITALFVYKDADGNIRHTCSSSARWIDMWYQGYCELDVPSLPKEAGTYRLYIYFNGAFVNTTDVTIK